MNTVLLGIVVVVCIVALAILIYHIRMGTRIPLEKMVRMFNNWNQKTGEIVVFRGTDTNEVISESISQIQAGSGGAGVAAAAQYMKLFESGNILDKNEEGIVLLSGSSVVYKFWVPEDNKYNFEFELVKPGGNSDSVFLQLDSDKKENAIFNINKPGRHTTTWFNQLHNGTNVPLTKGYHTLTLSYREPMLLLNMHIKKMLTAVEAYSHV
jgi:hypothetical protein